MALLPPPSGVTASLPAHCAPCHQGPKAEPGSGLRAPLESHSKEGDRWRGVPLAAVGWHQPRVVLFATTTEIFAGKRDFAKMERGRRMKTKAPLLS